MDFIGNLPSFADALNYSPQAAAPPPPALPQATGTGNWLTAGLGSGFYSTLSQLGSAGEAGARAVGAGSLADQAQQFAAQQRAKAQTFARPDLEDNAWTPGGLAYRVAQSLPAIAGTLGGALVGAAAAPEEGVAAGLTGLGGLLARHAGVVGAGLAAYPLSVGENVQRQQDYSGDLSQGQAAKALALGVPEAALQSILPAQLEGKLLKGVAGKTAESFLGQLKQGAVHGATTQLPVGAVNEWLTQQMGDPNRPFADRAQDVVNAALQGAVLGGLTGAAIHPAAAALHGLAKKPVATVTNDAMSDVVDKSLAPPDQSQEAVPPIFNATPDLTHQVAPGENTNEPSTGQQANQPLPIAAANPQLELPLGDAPLVPRGNDNPPPTIVPPPDLPPGPGTRDPALIPANGGLNDNEAARVTTTDATQQPQLDLAQPTVPGTNDNATGFNSGPFREDMKKLPEFRNAEFKTNDEFAVAVAKSIIDRDAANKPIPASLERLGHKLGVLDEEGNVVPPKAAATDANVSATKAPDTVGTAADVSKGPSAPERVDRAAIPAAHQARFDDLEALRNRLLGDNLSDPDKMGLLNQTASLQNELLNVQGSGRTGQIVKQIKALKTVVEGRDAAKELAKTPAPTPVDAKQPAVGTEPSPQAKAFVEAQAPTKLTKEAQRKGKTPAVAKEVVKPLPDTLPVVDNTLDRLAAAKAKGPRAYNDEMQKIGAEAIAKRGTETPAEPAPTKEAQRKAAKAAPAAEASAAPAQIFAERMAEAKANKPRPLAPEAIAQVKRQKVESQLDQALTAHVEGGKPIVPVPPKITEQIAKAKEALAKLTTTAKPKTEGTKFNTPKLQKLIQAHADRLDMIEKAAQYGGAEALKLFPSEHLGTDLFDQASGKLTPESEEALDAHASAEEDIMSSIRDLRGERPLIGYSSTPTQHDVDLAHVISGTGKVKSVLAYLRQHGTTGIAKEMANKLHAIVKDGSISLGDDAEAAALRQKYDGRDVQGVYYGDDNSVKVFDGADVESTVLHEAAHNAFDAKLEGNSPAATEMQGLFDRVQDKHDPLSNYGLTNVHEFVAEAFSNPKFQEFLRNEPAETGSKLGNMWQSFKNSVFRALGMPERARSLFDQVMDKAQQLGSETSDVGTASGVRARIIDKGISAISEAADAVKGMSTTKLVREASGVKLNMKTSAREQMLGWTDLSHIAQVYSKFAPAMKDFVGLMDHKTVRTDMLMKLEGKAQNMASALEKKPKEALLNSMARTAQGIDPRKKWEELKHLHTEPNIAALKQEHAQAVRDFDVLRRTTGGVEAYENLRAANAAKLSAKNIHHMYDFMAREYPDDKPAGFETDPFRDYDAGPQVEGKDIQDNPLLAERWWKTREEQMRKSMVVKADDIGKDLTKALKQRDADQKEPDPTKRLSPELRQDVEDKIKKLSTDRKAATSMLQQIDMMNNHAAEAPYFHLGREGDYYVAAHLPVDEKGLPKQASIAKLQEALGKDYGDISVMQGLTNDAFYARVGSPSEMDGLHGVLKELHDAGHLDKAKPLSSGQAFDPSIVNAISPAYVRQGIEALKQNPPYLPPGSTPIEEARIRAAHAQSVRDATRALIAMMPQTSLVRLYQRREGVQGFSKNMLQSYQKSAISNSRGLANLSLARETGAVAKQMQEQIRLNNQNAARTSDERIATSQAANELILHNKQSQIHVPNTPMDAVRRLTHTFQVGMSPGYVLTLGSQVATLSHPELAKTHGYVNAAAALAKGTNPAFAMMRAVMTSPDAATFGVRQEALVKANLSQKDVDFHMAMARRGLYTQGFTEAQTGHETTGTLSKFTQYANSLGRYAEMFPRVQMALAARELFNQKPVKGYATAEDFAHAVTSEAQMNWNPELNARQTTRSGMFGAMSPLINQFMGFQIRMTEKLYREVANGFGKAAATPEDAAAARTWIYTHAAAVTMLAGTLGLPMLGVAASVFDRLADLVTGKDDYDVVASYRNFLASTFGKETGEVIARGAPRALGADFDHLGEDHIAPGSSLLLMLTEKRKMEDAEKDWLKSMGGSSIGYLFNLAAAGRDLSNGDYMDGAIKMVPEILKTGMEAYRLDQRGFVDKNGQKLPITANAADIMMTALGIDPAKEAEYGEEKKVSTGLQALRTNRSQNITRHLLLAQNRGDASAFQEWQAKALEFQQDHPGMAGPLADFGRAVSLHERSSALARGFGTPLGVQGRDIIGRGMTGFGNLRGE